MAKKNVWLEDEGADLLEKARQKYVKDKQDSKVTDDKTITEALKVYLNG